MKAGRPTSAALALAEDPLDAHRFSHEAMATVFEVICVHDDSSYAAQGAHAAFELVDQLERELSRFIPNSDISRVNALAPGQTTRVSPSTMQCLEIAWRMHALTGHAFDVSVGSGLEGLELDPPRRVVRARGGGARLDLGGIGKGYAIDRMAELLEDWDLRTVLIHGGFSSVLAREAPPGRDGWPLTLTEPGPGPGRSRERISARHMALSASGTRKGDHVLDPLGGGAVRDRAAWAILSGLDEPEADARGADTEWLDARRWPAAVAEALSTAFMILPVHEIGELCSRGPALEAWLVREATGEGPRGGLFHVAACRPFPGRMASPGSDDSLVGGINKG